MTSNELPDNKQPKTVETKLKPRSAMTAAISKNTKILALFAITCTLAVALVNEFTKEIIKTQEHQHLLSTLNSIIEPSRYDNDIANDCVVLNSPELGSVKDNIAYIARKADDVIAIAVTSTAPEGYNGNIDFIIAINLDGTVSGVRVLKHQETPGLGDKIELKRSPWITRFKGESMLSEEDSRWAVKKDNGIFDQFTGATITPRAMISAIKKTLVYINKNRDRLLNSENACHVADSISVNPEPEAQTNIDETQATQNTPQAIEPVKNNLKSQNENDESVAQPLKGASDDK